MDLAAKLDSARTKIQGKLAVKAGIGYPLIQYRVKTTTGDNPARGVSGTISDADTPLYGALYRIASLAEVARAGGLLQEGDIVLDKVSLSVTQEQIEAARDPGAAVFVVDALEFRVKAYKKEPVEAPLWWVITCNKAT